MNVANIDLCKELYELSGWNNTQNLFDPWGQTTTLRQYGGDVPAYDLGYLLRKLPAESNVMNIGDKWFRATHYLGGSGFKHIYKTADTPEDAACKLVIELFKQHLIQKKEET